MRAPMNTTDSRTASRSACGNAGRATTFRLQMLASLRSAHVDHSSHCRSGRRARCRGLSRRAAPSEPVRSLAEDAVELGVAAEPGLERGGEGGGAASAGRRGVRKRSSRRWLRKRVIETPVWALKMRLRCDGLSPAVRASASRPPALRVGAQQAGDGFDRGVDVDAGDEILALEERAPGGEQEVGEAGVEQRIVTCRRRAARATARSSGRLAARRDDARTDRPDRARTGVATAAPCARAPGPGGTPPTTARGRRTRRRARDPARERATSACRGVSW